MAGDRWVGGANRWEWGCPLGVRKNNKQAIWGVCEWRARIPAQNTQPIQTSISIIVYKFFNNFASGPNNFALEAGWQRLLAINPTSLQLLAGSVSPFGDPSPLSPAILRSRIFRHNASALRFGQFSNFCEKLLKNLYSRIVTDMRRCILASFGSAVLDTCCGSSECGNKSK